MNNNVIIPTLPTRTSLARKQSAARLSVYSNTLLTLLKLVFGALTGSASILSEAAHSSSDLVASWIALFAVRAAERPADEEHPYGHGKIESLSGMAEGLLIFVAGAFVVYEAVSRMVEYQAPRRLELGVGVMVFSAMINSVVARQLFVVARETDSPALYADAQHLGTDIITSLGVMVGLILVQTTGFVWIDPVVALIVAAIIFHAAWKLTRGAFHPLIDSQLPENEIAIVRGIVESDLNVLAYHKLRTRKAGSSRHVDAHILMDDHLTLLESHTFTEALEDRIRMALPNAEITLHTEPYLAERKHQAEAHSGAAPTLVETRPVKL